MMPKLLPVADAGCNNTCNVTFDITDNLGTPGISQTFRTLAFTAIIRIWITLIGAGHTSCRALV